MVDPLMATVETDEPAANRYTTLQSHPTLAAQTVFHAFVLTHTYCPAVTQRAALCTSVSMGAMNSGSGSHSPGGSDAPVQDGEISR